MKVKCLILLLFPYLLHCQVSFEPSTNAFGNIEIHSQIPIAIVDINNDLLDDMITLDKGNHLKVFYQSQNESSFYYKDYGQVSTFDQLAIGTGDIDNDGIREIFIGGYYDGIKVYKAFGDSDDYLQFKKTEATFYTQNISLVDIDLDGYLDLFVNDDDGPPQIYQNQGGQDFSQVEWINFTHEGEAGSGNYGCIWTDVDLDGDLDLYISKCRLGVDSPEDSRRINQLYINDGLGNFEEQAKDFGLASGEQSWVSEFTDLDNDGDKDVVIVNHSGPNEVLENMGNGTYEALALGEDWNAVFEGLQLIIRDFDNDGLKDILIGGIESKLFWNKGGLTFEEDKNFIGNKEAVSLAVGDLNNDGFWDIYNSYSNGITEENKYVRDEIMLNKGNDHHFLKLSLRFEDGNRDAIGSTCELYGPWGMQSYELRSGESYGISNSLAVIFGIGSNEVFDSLLIKWPNGAKMHLTDLDINKHYVITSSACIGEQFEINEVESNILCSGEEILLSAPNFTTYQWSNGEIEPEAMANFPALYRVTVSDEKGCLFVSSSLDIKEFSEIGKPEIYNLYPEKINCSGDSITLVSQYEKVRWNGGIESYSFVASANDSVFASVDICDGLFSDIYLTNTLQVDTPEYQLDTILKGEDAEFVASGNTVYWYESLDSEAIIGQGNTYTIPGLENDTVLYAQQIMHQKEYDSLNVDLSADEFGLPPSQINGGLIFSIEKYNVILESVLCFTDTAAMRLIQVLDYWGNVIHEKEVMISPSDSLIDLNFDLAPSSYYLLTTSGDYNVEQLGSRSARLKRSFYGESIYDLESKDGNVVVHTSTGGPDVYYSFYNWKLLNFDVTCESDRVGVPIIVNESSAVEFVSKKTLFISPNPFENKINLEGDYKLNEPYFIYRPNGQLVKKGKLASEIDLGDLAEGLYFFQIDGNVYKLIKS